MSTIISKESSLFALNLTPKYKSAQIKLFSRLLPWSFLMVTGLGTFMICQRFRQECVNKTTRKLLGYARLSPYLSALDFWHSPVLNIKFYGRYFFPSLNWIFADYTGSKNPVQTWKNIQFVKLENFKLVNGKNHLQINRRSNPMSSTRL